MRPADRHPALAPPPIPVAGAVSGDDALASLEQMVAIAGWMRRFSDRARSGQSGGRKVEAEGENRSS